MFSVRATGRQKERVTEKGGGKRMWDGEKRERTESDENGEECPPLTRRRSAWCHFISARANCLAIYAMLFNRRLGDTFNIYDVSESILMAI